MDIENTEKTKQPKDSQVLLDKQFLKHIEDLSSVEEKLRCCLDRMKATISQDKVPIFKEFWEIRRYCLPLFKENLNSFVRSSFWKEFLDLTTEARRLKEILDEQSSFTVEQIDLALDALEKELQEYQENTAPIACADLPDHSTTLKSSLEELAKLQGEINLLNTLITRQSSLRQELISTDMRVRYKNNFFKRISKIGDFLFPKRKEIIQALSEVFFKRVSDFVSNHFQNDQATETPYYILKDEIKAIQNIGKYLNLNNKTFTETRNMLSSSWDQMREVEKEKRKEFSEQRAVYLENKNKVQEQVNALHSIASTLSFDQIDVEINKIHRFMRTMELGKEEVKDLKKQLSTLIAPFEAKRLKEQEEKREQEQAELKKRLEKIESLKLRINETIDRAHEFDAKNLSVVVKEIQSEMESLALKKYEKQSLERSFKPLRDLLLDLKEKALLNLSENELKSLENLRQILSERKKRRKEIKQQLEAYRKESGNSGFDFEKAMAYRETIDMEKQRLEKIVAGIADIENKISEIEGS